MFVTGNQVHHPENHLFTSHSHYMEWDDFENLLLAEFRSILSNYKCIESTLTCDTRKDFDGLLKYILKDRAKFREVAIEEYGCSDDDSSSANNDNDDAFDAELFINTLPTSRLPSFSPEFSQFPLLLQLTNASLVPRIMDICEMYWCNRYPSLKESFIIPFTAKYREYVTPTLQSLLKRRLLKGKLAPFDSSVLLAHHFNIFPSDFVDGYVDHQLAALKEILSNNLNSEKEINCVLQQSGCHCD